MNIGYASLVWITEADGREYVCSLDDIKSEKEPGAEERAKCMDVSLLIGTERW